MMYEADINSDGKLSYEVTTKQSLCIRGNNGEMKPGEKEWVLF